jgi:hypothetical protein
MSICYNRAPANASTAAKYTTTSVLPPITPMGLLKGESSSRVLHVGRRFLEDFWPLETGVVRSEADCR